MNLAEFISMSGYGEYVWSSYGFALVVLVANVAGALRRLGKARRLDAQSDGETVIKSD